MPSLQQSAWAKYSDSLFSDEDDDDDNDDGDDDVDDDDDIYI